MNKTKIRPKPDEKKNHMMNRIKSKLQLTAHLQRKSEKWANNVFNLF